jgi:pyridinium-3,5-biscarboxylic acid mononucleotide synthase
MSVGHEVNFDRDRHARIGLAEAVLCAGKSAAQIAHILDEAANEGRSLLLTRLDEAALAALPEHHKGALDYHELSRTAVFGEPAPATGASRVAVVTGGTSDAGPGYEAARTLSFSGEPCELVFDVGVAGLWRLLDQVERLREMSVLIAVAGMDAALVSVLGGLVPGVVVAVPTSTGYGVASGGETALKASLTSCSPGVLTVNIDNGYGAACAALRILRAIDAR